MAASSESFDKIFNTNDEMDPRSMEFLMNALQNNNQPDFDYLEFKQSLAALIQLPMDVTLAMKSAYTTGTTLGLTKEKLIQSAEFYKQILQKEKVQFDLALKNQTQQKVEGRKSEQQKLAEQIQRNKELIRKLQEEIDDFQSEMDKINAEVEENIARIEQSRYKFEHTYSEMINQINQDILSINNSL